MDLTTLCFHCDASQKRRKVGTGATLFGILIFLLGRVCRKWVHSVERLDVVTRVDTSFLQMFLWERFGAIKPKPYEFQAIKMVEAVACDIRTEIVKQASLYKLRA